MKSETLIKTMLHTSGATFYPAFWLFASTRILADQISILPAMQIQFYKAEGISYTLQSFVDLDTWSPATVAVTNDSTYTTGYLISQRGSSQRFYRVASQATTVNPKTDIQLSDYPLSNGVGTTNRIALLFRYREALRNPFT